MRISIIIPVLNEAAHIQQACRAARQLAVDEVIVVDGGSRDDTPNIAAESGCRVTTAQRGRASQQNAGALLATGEVLLFLHADTWLERAARSQILACLSDPRVVAGGFRQRIDSHGIGYRLLELGNALRVRWCSTPYGDQGIFVRRTAFDAVNGFDDVPLLEDLLLARKLRKLGRVALLPGPLHVSPRRWQRHGIVRQTLRNWSILIAHRLGASPQRLAAYYRRHDL